MTELTRTKLHFGVIALAFSFNAVAFSLPRDALLRFVLMGLAFVLNTWVVCSGIVAIRRMRREMNGWRQGEGAQ